MLFVPLLSYSQDYSRDDILGDWKISKCGLYINNAIYKTSYINETNSKVLEGKYTGEMDDDINKAMKAIVGSNIFFNSDSTVTWNASVNDLDISNAYWQLSDPDLIVFCEWRNRARLRPILLECKIIALQPNMMYLKAFEAGMEFRITLNK